MKFHIFVICMFLFGGSVILGGMAYSKIGPLSLKMPANIEELSTWDEDDIYKLQRDTLKCHDVPGYHREEPSEFERWRNICRSVNQYWTKAYKQKKIDEGLEKFKSLDLPQ